MKSEITTNFAIDVASSAGDTFIAVDRIAILKIL